MTAATATPMTLPVGPAPQAPDATAPPNARTQQMLTAPLLPTLLRLATPNVIGLFAMTIMIGYDGYILGLLGPDALAGAAWSTLAVNTAAALMLGLHLLRQGGAVRLQAAPWRFSGSLLQGILRVGLPASLSPVISNASIAVATAVVGSYGTAALAGYGVAARLEYILVPIAFGFGTALTTMVATNMGAGQSARALRVTWIGGALVAAITGAIGITVAVFPALWMNLFTSDATIRGLGASYLRIVGGGYGLFGLGLALFFASQGAGRMFWPLAGSLARLVVVAVGGWLCVSVLQAPATAFYGVVALSLAVYAAVIGGAIWLGSWQVVQAAPVSAARTTASARP
jgi:Na+-driven multidrug efflux pump